MLPNSAHWQPALGRNGFVEDIEDIRQSIRIILETPQGSDPLRPEFGSNIYQYIDRPIDRARPHLVREAVRAIRRWEPRVTVVRVQVEQGDGPAHVLIRIEFRLADGALASAEVRA
jgi:hypothetical protein